MKSIGDKIKEQRVLLNMTQAELSEKTGIAVRSISCYEGGKVIPRGSSVRKLSAALCVSEAFLLNPQIEDPAYGLAAAPYADAARGKYGVAAAMDITSLLEANRQLFAGGDVPQEDKDLFFRAVFDAYMDTKQTAHERFTPNKFRESKK